MSDEGIVYPDFGESISSGGVTPSGTEIFLRLVDSRIDANEHRIKALLSETKSELLNLINARSSRVDVWGVGAVIIATLLALAAFGSDRFDGGVQLQSSVSDVVRQAFNAADKNATAIKQLTVNGVERDKKLDRILGKLEAPD